MKVHIYPGLAAGRAAAPPSKSMAHRLLIAAGLAKGQSRITGLALSEDVAATIDCLRALGATVTLNGGEATVTGADPRLRPAGALLPCRESGSTLRFMIPLCLLAAAPCTLTGCGRLLHRPQTVYADLCRGQGLPFAVSDAGVQLCGPLQGGDFTLPGDVSSQFITGLLLALPLTGRPSRLHLTGEVQSRPYIDLTLQAMAHFGLTARFEDERTIALPAGCYRPADATVEGDYSNAAFLEALGVLGGNVCVTGLNPASLQGDRVYKEGFAALQNGFCRLSLADCPDLGPIYMALAAACHGAEFTHTARLKIKESDRAAAMAAELAKFGVALLVEDDRVVVPPAQLTPPALPLCAHGDHRIVMALATLCTRTGGVIEGAEAVAKSYPDYFSVLSSLGIVWKEETE